jgi:hypothetical protein
MAHAPKKKYAFLRLSKITKPLKKLTKRNKVLILGIVLVLAIGGGYAGYRNNQQQKKKRKAEDAAMAQKAANSFPFSAVVYAYKQENTTKVRRYNVGTDKIDELFTFDQLAGASRPDDGWLSVEPSVSLSHDNRSYIYEDKGSLTLRNADGITKTLFTCTPTSSTPATCTWDKNPHPAGDAPLTVASLGWSVDDNFVGYSALYEGGNAKVLFNPTEKTFAQVGDTFLDDTKQLPELNGAVFPLKLSNAPLHEAGMFAENFLQPTAFVKSDYAPSTKSIAAIFCPTDKAETYGVGYGNCVESPKQVVTVDAITGAYTKQLEGDFTNVAAIDDSSFVVVDKTPAWRIRQYDTDAKKEGDPLLLADLLKWPNETIKQVDLNVFDGRAFAVAFYGETGKRWYVTVIDITTRKVVSSSSIDHATGGFKLLGVY